jgi:HEPN domain-containing protein|tara:strand:- start:27388 stop:27912 length:525 start_codon:yes stop_codon:yes gene_type:complete
MTMAKKEIKLLQQQIDKLYIKDFDFDAWKKYSLLQLTRIFGKNDPKISQLQNIEFEFNSWSLRDASGNESYEEGSKRLAKEVLQVAIDELDMYGVPKNDDTSDDITTDLITIILDEFKGSQVKVLKDIISSSDGDSEKRRKIKELLEELGQFVSIDILTNILSNTNITGKLTSQ